MARRNFRRAKKGQLYCIEWPEWHVDCADPECENSRLCSPLGEADDSATAERKTKEDERTGRVDGWVCRKGLWYCPECKSKAGAE